MTWLLRPGLAVVRRDGEHLQLGLGARRAVLPAVPAVRRLLRELAAGAPLTTLDDVAGRALRALAEAGLVAPAEEEAARAAARAGCAVHLDVPPDLLPAALRLLGEAGLSVAGATDAVDVALVWAVGELSRSRLDGWMRTATPHLAVRETPDGPVLGPYVVPGATACLRCVDAHAAQRDPRHPLVVEQLATSGPLRPAAPDPARRALALAWAVRDLATAAEGGVPATWSSTIALGELPPELTAYHRHVHCGCTWAEELAAPDPGGVARAG
ncbi:hypothetical protein G5V58_15170 [Nocardioides anomalus]|uniref:TOMM leader peptide-binding protein n=1 Tax=Nocardioides anomalus TaxID=2712223 RepID=A0A6G6WFC1_9ACTN|nr:hypothetical protein [Nocardioides anomalus]QIG43932.1 hypothetical protein G5V58_15170 [Nocardioides anomalus]